MSSFPSRVPTTSTALTNVEKKLLKMMKKKLNVEDEDAKDKLPFTQISTLASVAKQEMKKDENVEIKDKEFINEKCGVRGYVYRFGCIKELQDFTQLTKAKSKSGKAPAKWTTIRLKATPIGDTTHSTGSSPRSSSSGVHQDLHQDGTSSSFKLSNFNFDLGDDHDRLVDYHYHDFVKHYGELDEDENEDSGSPPPPYPPPRNSSINNNSTRQQMDASILQLKCMQAALSPAKFKAICRLMKQYRSGKMDLETFQRRQAEIFAGEKEASGTLKHFFPLCRNFRLKIPKKKNKEPFKNSNVNKKVAVECSVATPDQEQLFCQKLQELFDQNIADMVGNEKKEEEIQDKSLPLPPPPPPPTSTAPPERYPKSEPPDEVPETDFASDIFQNILRLLAKVKGHDTALFLAVMETIFEAFLSGEPKTYRFYDALAHQVIKLLEPHFSLEDDEDIQRCFGFWL